MQGDDDDYGSEAGEYIGMPGKKIKRRRKKGKKKKKQAPQKEPVIDIRDLKMAKAYGGLT